MRAALWKYDRELGIAYFCPVCKTFVCMGGKCECGTEIDMSLKKTKYEGRVFWEYPGKRRNGDGKNGNDT